MTIVSKNCNLKTPKKGVFGLKCRVYIYIYIYIYIFAQKFAI